MQIQKKIFQTKMFGAIILKLPGYEKTGWLIGKIKKKNEIKKIDIGVHAPIIKTMSDSNKCKHSQWLKCAASPYKHCSGVTWNDSGALGPIQRRKNALFGVTSISTT